MKIIFITLIFSFCSFFLIGQESNYIHPSRATHDAFFEKVNSIIENLDLTQVRTGVLREKGMGFFAIDNFEGEITENSKSSLLSFGLSYATISGMYLNEKNHLPDPILYRNKMDKINEYSEEILIAGLHQEYETIDENAIEKGLFTMTNEQLFDVPGRTESPYLKKDLFLFAPASHFVANSTINLRFDSELFYSNTNKTIQNLEVDMGNDEGFKSILFDSIVSAQYGTIGVKNIKVKISYTDGSEFYSHFDMTITQLTTKSVTASPDISYYVPQIGNRGGGHIYAYLSCEHESITKPFIWAEGFNPSVGSLNMLSLTKENAIERLSTSDTEINGIPLWTYLKENGFDIILLDYDDGGDYLPRTAEFIKEAIRWVNTQKQLSGSHEKNVIMGQSMGGPCTMKALRDMELSPGEDHQTGTFIVFDSPLQGVNVPVSSQAMLLDIAFLPLFPTFFGSSNYLKDFVSQIDDVYRLLRTPAARTMIRYLDPGVPEPSLWQSFYGNLHSAGMPIQCEVLTITNGSNKGSNGKQPFNAGDLILHSNINNFTLVNLIGGKINPYPGYVDYSVVTPASIAGGVFLSWSGINVNTDIKLYATPGNPANSMYYRGHFSASFLYIPLTFSVTERYMNEIIDISLAPEIDCAPGGFVGNKQEPIFLEQLLTNAGAFNALAPHVFKLHTWCFTPTVSVLNYHAIPGDNNFYDLYHNFQNNTSELLAHNPKDVDNYVSNGFPRISSVPQPGIAGYNVGYKNTAHTWFTPENTGFMHYHLISEDLLYNLGSPVSILDAPFAYNYGKAILSPYHVYNYGGTSIPRSTSAILDHNLTVKNTKLGINASGLNIGLTNLTTEPSPNGTPPNSSFTVQLGKSCSTDEPIILTIENGAELIIGDGLNRVGTLIANKNHRIVINSGGKLTINKNCAIILNGSAKLELNPGAIVVNNGEIHLNGISTLEHSPNVTLDMYLDKSEIVFNGGHLELKDNAIFTFNNAFPEQGTIRVRKNATVYSEHNSLSNCEFKLVGNNIWKPLMIIEKNATLKTVGNGSYINLVSLVGGEIHMYENSQFIVQNKFHAHQMHFYNAESNQPATMQFGQYTTIGTSDFSNITVKADFSFIPSVIVPIQKLFSVSSSTVKYRQDGTAFKITKGPYKFFNCNFEMEFNTNNSSFPIAIYGDMASTNSSVVGSKFYGSTLRTTFIIDKSNSKLDVMNSTLDIGLEGIVKEWGILDLRCNNILNLRNGVRLKTNSILDMAYGYNRFYNIYETSIALESSQVPIFENGYNSFAPDPWSIPYNYVMGNIVTNTLNINSSYNRWNPWATIPGNFDVDNVNGVAVNFLQTSPITDVVSCGRFDPGSGGPVHGEDPSSLIIKNTANAIMLKSSDHDNNAPTMEDVYSDVVNLLKEENNNYSELVPPIERVHKILTFDYSSFQLNEKELEATLDIFLNKMKELVYNSLKDENHQVKTIDNYIVKLYIDALNTKTKYIENENNSHLFYANEVEKVFLFYSINEPETALSIISNIEKCDIDSTSQSYLNFLKFNIEEQIAKMKYGVESIFLDTIFTNTDGYKKPVKLDNPQYYFSSYINPSGNVTFTSDCQRKTLNKSMNKVDVFSVFPNPASDKINIEYEILTNKKSSYQLLSLEGKVLLQGELSKEKGREIIDIHNLPSGLYIISFSVDNVIENTVKISKL